MCEAGDGRIVLIVHHVHQQVSIAVQSTKQLHTGEIREIIQIILRHRRKKLVWPTAISWHRSIDQGEILHPAEHWVTILQLIGSMKTNVGGCDLSQDMKWIVQGREHLLHFFQPPMRHVGSGVQTKAIDIKFVHQPHHIFFQLFSDKGHTLIQIGQVIKPALLRHHFVVSGTLVVANTAIFKYGGP